MLLPVHIPPVLRTKATPESELAHKRLATLLTLPDVNYALCVNMLVCAKFSIRCVPSSSKLQRFKTVNGIIHR